MLSKEEKKIKELGKGQQALMQSRKSGKIDIIKREIKQDS